MAEFENCSLNQQDNMKRLSMAVHVLPPFILYIFYCCMGSAVPLKTSLCALIFVYRFKLYSYTQMYKVLCVSADCQC